MFSHFLSGATPSSTSHKTLSANQQSFLFEESFNNIQSSARDVIGPNQKDYLGKPQVENAGNLSLRQMNTEKKSQTKQMSGELLKFKRFTSFEASPVSQK